MPLNKETKTELGVVVLDRIPYMDQIELFDKSFVCTQLNDVKLNC